MCQICGKPSPTIEINWICPACQQQAQPKDILNHGWVCPKCGAVYSPMTPTCWICHPRVITS